MKVKKLIPFSVILILILLCGGSMLSKPSAVQIFHVLTAFSVVLFIIDRSHENFRFLLIQSLILTGTAFLIMHIQAATRFKPSLDINDITSISGTLIYDSSLTQNGNSLLNIRLSDCSNIYGNSASASGLVKAVINSRQDICAGCSVRLSGRFSDNLFIVSSLTVTKKKTVHYLRERLISVVRRRLINTNNPSSSLLSLQLLLGTSEDDTSGLSSLAANCGCLHVLALSGMHLNVITSMFNVFGKKKKFTSFLKYIAATVFVFIAGPRPSLIRALIMVYLSFLPPDERLVCAFAIQCLVFPYHMVNIGCIFAYASTFAILVIRPYVSKLVPPFVGTSISVMLLNAPVQLLFNGCWYPSAIITGPVAGFLAGCSMLSGLVKLALPSFRIPDRVNEITYSALYNLFSMFSGSGCRGLSFAVFLIIILILTAIRLYLRRFSKL